MAESWGPLSNYQQVWFSYSVTNTSSTQTKIVIGGYLHIQSGGSVYGNWQYWHSGSWGSGSATTYIGSPLGSPTNHFFVGGGSYVFTRGSSDYTVRFNAAIQTALGYIEHGVTITIPKVPATAPPAPTKPTVSQITATGARVQFSSTGTGGAAITRWDLQYSTSSTFASGNETITSTGTSTLTGLANKTKYYLRARGVNSVGTGAWSAVANFTTLGLPGAPTIAVSSLTTTGGSYTVTDPSYTGGSITNYEVQLSADKSFATYLKTWTTKTGSFSDLLRGGKYYVRARVKNSTGWSAWTSAVEFTMNVVPPSAPTGFTITDIGSTSAYVSLPAVADNGGGPLVGIRATVSTSIGGTPSVMFTEDEFRTVFLFDLEPGQDYYVWLEVQNAGVGGGWGPKGGWVRFTTRSDVPTPPDPVTISNIDDYSALLTWGEPDDLLGSTPLGYTIRVASNKSFSVGAFSLTDAFDSGLSQGLSGLQPGSKYWVQLRMDSTNGPGSWSTPVSFTTTGQPPTPQATWMRVSGVWRTGKMWLRVAGTWREVTLWQKNSGTWRKG